MEMRKLVEKLLEVSGHHKLIEKPSGEGFYLKSTADDESYEGCKRIEQFLINNGWYRLDGPATMHNEINRHEVFFDDDLDIHVDWEHSDYCDDYERAINDEPFHR